MFKSFLFTTIIAIALFITNVHAALVTSISALDIAGEKFDVTFHNNISFNDLFDADGDGNFYDADGSLLARAPLFFGDSNRAEAASLAIISFLGSKDTVDGLNDAVLVPFGFFQASTVTDDLGVNAFTDSSGADLQFDFNARLGIFAIDADPRTFWATFEATTTQVSAPPQYALTGLALAVMVGMGTIGRRRSQ